MDFDAISWVFMPNGGNLRLFCLRIARCSCPVLGLCTVDKSVRRPNRRINRQVTGESAFEVAEQLEQFSQLILDGASISLGHFGVQEVCVRYNSDLTFPHPTFGNDVSA